MQTKRQIQIKWKIKCKWHCKWSEKEIWRQKIQVQRHFKNPWNGDTTFMPSRVVKMMLFEAIVRHTNHYVPLQTFVKFWQNHPASGGRMRTEQSRNANGGEFDERAVWVVLGGVRKGEVFNDESGKWRLLWRFLQVEMDDGAQFVSRGSFVVSCLRAGSQEQLDKWLCSTAPAARALCNLCPRDFVKPSIFITYTPWKRFPTSEQSRKWK